MPAPEPRLWWNGPIVGIPRADALYAEDGRVVAVGPADQVLRAVPGGTERVDLAGRSVIPGLVDAHLHVGASIQSRSSADLSCVRSLPELVDVLRRHLEIHPGPLLGEGWDQERLAEGRMPTRTDLDVLATDQPIVLYRRCGHVATLNSAAMQAAGIHDAAEDPPNGRVGRTNGIPDGRLFEGAMDGLAELEERWWPWDAIAARRWLRETASLGITRLGAMSAEPAELRGLRVALESEAPTVRASAYLRASWLEQLPGLRRELDSPWLRVAGVKVMADGSLGARTAWLSDPYHDAPGESGAPRTDLIGIERVLRTLAPDDRAATAIHAIGDRALSTVLDAVDAVANHGRVRIEHASLAPPASIDRAVAHRIPLVVQPSFVPSDTWISQRLGSERARWAYPFRTMLLHGAHLAGSSDSPVESRDPWSGMAAATAPRPGSGENLEPSQALDLYTRGSAEALGDPGGGTLTVGARADLVVLGARSWPEALGIGRAAVDATYLGGRLTFESPRSRASQGL